MPTFARLPGFAALVLGFPLVSPAFPMAARAATPEAARFERLCARVAASYDSARGGFVAKDDSPVESAVELAFALDRDGGDPAWIARARRTVSWTLGLYDSTGGGFFTRMRDADPRQTMFEKRTIPNSRRLENLIDAWRASGAEEDHDWAARVADYFDRVLLDARGGFVAGQVGDRELLPEANGFAIHAWLRWAAATADPRLRDFALKSLDRVWESCWHAEAGLLRRGTFGELKAMPALVDQVEMGRAYALGAHLGGREADLARARTLGELLLERFADPARSGFASQARPGKEGKIKRSGREFDQNARAARFLAELAAVTGEPKYREAARAAARSFEKDFEKADAAAAAEWALALRALSTPDLPARPVWKEPAVKQPAPVRTRFKATRR